VISQENRPRVSVLPLPGIIKGVREPRGKIRLNLKKTVIFME
jgi:hypothetical protein